MILRLLCLLACLPVTLAAAPKAGPRAAQPIWELAFAEAEPVAAFFDVNSGSIFVSLRDGDGARLDRVSLEGKLLETAVAHGRGAPGTMRAFDGRVYWIAGERVVSVKGKGQSTLDHGRVPSELGAATDIAVSGKGDVFLGMSTGALYRLEHQAGSVQLRGAPITGLYLLEGTLFVLRGARLQAVGLALDTDASRATPSVLCSARCVGLERGSNGRWLTTLNGTVIETGAGSGPRHTLLRTKGELGRLAYVFRKEPKEDFFVLPFPRERKLRAYRMP